jgi:hypothetical protein
MFTNFWIPNQKPQLVNLLSLTYPQDKNKFERMTKKRLYAILFSIRRKQCYV